MNSDTWYKKLLQDTIIRYHKEAAHEFILTCSCHSIFFRGFVNEHYQLEPPVIGYNIQAEKYYKSIQQSLIIRFKALLEDPLTFDWKIAGLLNEMDTCIGAVKDLHDFILDLKNQAPATHNMDLYDLYLYSFQFILKRIENIQTIYKKDFASLDFLLEDGFDFDFIPTQQEAPDF